MKNQEFSRFAKQPEPNGLISWLILLRKTLRKGKIRVAAITDEVDLIISLPKFKNHELVYFTGAIKNTLGLVPGFSKGKQHALHQDRSKFGEFLVDLNEAVTPDYFLMDGIMGMEGPGPGRGFPVEIGLLFGSTNPLVLRYDSQPDSRL